jgi:hypothetical protein
VRKGTRHRFIKRVHPLCMKTIAYKLVDNDWFPHDCKACPSGRYFGRNDPRNRDLSQPPPPRLLTPRRERPR